MAGLLVCSKHLAMPLALIIMKRFFVMCKTQELMHAAWGWKGWGSHVATNRNQPLFKPVTQQSVWEIA